MINDPKVIVALDFDNMLQLDELVGSLSPSACRLKIGKEMFTRFGPDLVRQLHKSGFDVFLDLKFHDIPQTVARAITAASELGVWMVNVHALGGEKMLSAAKTAVENVGGKTKLIAVTILTSHKDSDLTAIGLSGTAQENANNLAKLSHNAGLDGVVCSAIEAKQIKALTAENFITVTPGIRPANYSTNDDQSRIMTPEKAIANGSDYLVIGRPITQSDNPKTTLEQINSQI